MKKLGKLTINPEKVIKNEELVNLKGGEYITVVCTFGGDYWGCGTDVNQCMQEGYDCCPNSSYELEYN
ncbi:hypothetical protein [Draconibacterium mangrovi]|uniref:hypothetical protein n=1 Tax=Draconibacterium mangrovi TaxID=2697469 RepID=UPI0013D3812E|nr:hypothetical protein [Draconibacterium mangrovi]